MSKVYGFHSADIQGAKQLTVDAVTGITDIVEAMHQTILSGGRISGRPGQIRARGITGGVYKSVRNITRWVGNGLDVPLIALAGVLKEAESSPRRDVLLSALNGVLGDYLHASNNPLAISMQFRSQGKSLSDKQLAEFIRRSNGRLAIMVHGSSMSDLQWHRRGHDHGSAITRDLGIATLYLHYNTGLHISENGRALAQRLESLATHASGPMEWIIIAHSMGGLVSRSACHYAQLSDYLWLQNLTKMVFLGTPHHGAPLEKIGNWVDTLLDISPYSAPLARLGKVRSSGITDLRHGNIVDEDWQDRDRFVRARHARTPVPLPSGVDCYAIAGARHQANKLADGLIGDGLVTLNSALGHHPDDDFQLRFPPTHQWVGRGINHHGLLSHPQVYETLRKWLTG